MKRIALMFIVCSACFSLFAAEKSKKEVVDFVHPLNWYAGMKNPKLQVLLHGDNIASMDVTLENERNITLDEVVKVENKNYLILYLNTSGAPTQNFNIILNDGKKTYLQPYQLLQKADYNRKSFDSSDVVYLLMPDRFANGSKENDVVEGMRETVCDSNIPLARHGGDLQGMTAKLDYLADLGVTAIWPTPVLENDMEMESYHGYAITNYYKIDPRYGTNEDYRNFVNEAHKRGIKIIKDLVFNHCGSFNPLFIDLPQKDWFNNDAEYAQSSYRTAAVADVNAAISDRSRTVDGWFVRTMPDFNQKNRLVKDYLIQTSIWWIEYAGIDGIRQDTYPYCDFNAMVEWCERIEDEYPGFNIVGEAWINNNVGVSYWQKDSKLAEPLNSKLKTVMDFPLMSLLNYVCDETTDDWDHGFARLYEYLGQDRVYADPLHLLTFLDNHDTDRFQKNPEMADNITRYQQALTLLLTLRGIPQLYYGNEVAMAANKSKGDGALRENFPGGWPGDSNDAFSVEGRTPRQNHYYNFTRNLLQWRKTAEAVHYGKLIHFHVRNGVYVYARKFNDKFVTVLLNGTNDSVSVDLEPYKEVLPKPTAQNIINHRNISLEKSISMKPKEVMVLDFNKN